VSFRESLYYFFQIVKERQHHLKRHALNDLLTGSIANANHSSFKECLALMIGGG
jgi:hypothetical protein